MKTYYKDIKSFDFILLSLVIIISIVGIVVIGSATRINVYGITEAFIDQIIFFISGLVILAVSAFIDIRFINKFYIVIYMINISLLIAVLLMDSTTREVQRWIKIGPATLQPSEFCKLFMILFLSKFIANRHDNINKIKNIFFVLSLIGFPVFLIFLQPALSASMVVLVLSCVVLYVGGLSHKIVLPAVIIGGGLIAFILIDAHLENPILIDEILKGYQIKRITGESDSQTIFSIEAIASGQLSGKGLFNGNVNQLNYLVESHNDFIFSVLSEEFGFIGSVGVLIVMLLIIFRILLIGFRSISIQGALICAGVAAIIGFQTIFNVGVGTGLLPNTGVTFPFLSAGGSSMWICMSSIGFVLNVSMCRVKSIFEE
ncbi:MAG: FtsW/RodA/SpoVE family cell cycle protein [Lachnospirales bacterium]